MKKIIAIITLTLLIIGCSKDDGGAESSTTYTLTQALLYSASGCSNNLNWDDATDIIEEIPGISLPQTITLNDNGTLEQYIEAYCDDITITTQSECELENMTCGDNGDEQCEWNEAQTQTLYYTQDGTSIAITELEEELSITLSGDTMTWEAEIEGMCIQLIYENI